jgi:hypothetical protein
MKTPKIEIFDRDNLSYVFTDKVLTSVYVKDSLGRFLKKEMFNNVGEMTNVITFGIEDQRGSDVF